MWQIDIQEHQVGSLAPPALDCRSAIGHADDVVAVLAQGVGCHIQHIGVIFNEQDSYRMLTHTSGQANQVPGTQR